MLSEKLDPTKPAHTTQAVDLNNRTTQFCALSYDGACRNTTSHNSSSDRIDTNFPVVMMVESWSSLRELTYLNSNHDDEYTNAWDASTVDTLWITFHSLLSLSFALIAYFVIRLVYSTKEFQEWKAISLLLPSVSVILALESATLAIDEAIPKIPTLWADLLYVFEALLAPGLFLSTFMVTFLAYRIRSVPFCCVRRRPRTFESEDKFGTIGEDASNDQELLVQSNIVIFGMHCFALVLLMVSILVNFDVMWSTSDLAGRTGWMTLILDPWEPSHVHVVLALLPMTLVCCCSLYFAALLCRYGNELSMTIYSSFINPWIWPIVGVVCMFCGLLTPSPWFAFTSNMGICIYQVTILRTLLEIRQDLGEATELGSYLRACWVTPAGVDATTTADDVLDEPPLRPLASQKSGVLREPTLSSGKPNTTHTSDSLDSTLL
jgi:hypothetical protein